ncbi:hypothetical protein PLANPX_1601 [Lacipirellula parvula]|uniref:Uncharacterized protein n=1 Tax=Lacipirellula parvula TaxID=2650471 RepID=A0A5K7XG96_9BACT|nr:hypothetical protein PLANPX_1601 [Lacipirellula parvula]
MAISYYAMIFVDICICHRYFHGMRPTLGIMITATTYGTWLRGDRRG